MYTIILLSRLLIRLSFSFLICPSLNRCHSCVHRYLSPPALSLSLSLSLSLLSALFPSTNPSCHNNYWFDSKYYYRYAPVIFLWFRCHTDLSPALTRVIPQFKIIKVNTLLSVPFFKVSMLILSLPWQKRVVFSHIGLNSKRNGDISHNYAREKKAKL